MPFLLADIIRGARRETDHHVTQFTLAGVDPLINWLRSLFSKENFCVRSNVFPVGFTDWMRAGTKVRRSFTRMVEGEEIPFAIDVREMG